MKKTLHERIAIIEARKARDQARLSALQGRQKKAERKRDDRRKILVGAIVMVEMERDPKFGAYLRRLLSKALTRPHDLEVMADLLKPDAEGAKLPASNTNTLPIPAQAEVTVPNASPGNEPEAGMPRAISGPTEQVAGMPRVTFPDTYRQRTAGS